MITFKSETQNFLVQHGAIQDKNMRTFIRDSLGITPKKVEAKRHTILSGTPGVGKTYGTVDECLKAGLNTINIPAGSTDNNIAIQLAHAVYTNNNKEVVVILDDADDVVFGDYQSMNKWKIAMSDVVTSLGIEPYYHHPVNMTNTLNSLQKAGKLDLVESVKAFQQDGQVGISIPTKNVRFVVLCNRDLQDPSSFRSEKMRSGVRALLSRFRYRRIDMDWQQQWGWLANVLINTQPFDNEHLDDTQKKELLEWMYSNWNNLLDTSYRMVRELTDDMINFPNEYVERWMSHLKGN